MVDAYNRASMLLPLQMTERVIAQTRSGSTDSGLVEEVATWLRDMSLNGIPSVQNSARNVPAEATAQQLQELGLEHEAQLQEPDTIGSEPLSAEQHDCYIISGKRLHFPRPESCDPDHPAGRTMCGFLLV